jgi:GDP-L-fucose synthase
LSRGTASTLAFDVNDASELQHARVYVAGHRGLAGSAIHRALKARGVSDIITRTHAELDLTERNLVGDFFHQTKPEVVFLCAAKVGGIVANATYPATFIHSNLAIQTNVFHEAWKAGVRRLVFLGSSCIYPRDCPQPIREDYLLSGPLEPTNRAYAIAKIAGVEACWSYNRQYGTEFVSLMPSNLYGPGDNYHPEDSHVMAARIRKAHEAKAGRSPSMAVWGSGAPRREFVYSDDLAEAALLVAGLSDEDLPRAFPADEPPIINVGAGADISIKELVELICQVVGYEGRIEWDPSRPDGTPRKLLDVSRIQALGWTPKTRLRDGIVQAYAEFLEHHTESAPLV